MNPLVSIIIPLYNREELVKETLDSVQAQTYPHWECIVVDDGSTDNSVATAWEYAAQDSRFKVFQRNREPKGAPTCRNIGLEMSGGEYVIFLDSDDLLADFCLERRVALFNCCKECDFLVFQSLVFQNDLNDTNKYFNVETNETALNRFLRTESLWAICGAFYKKDYLKGWRFNESLLFWQDVELAVRILTSKPHYKPFLSKGYDIFIRMSEDSVSRSSSFWETPELLVKRVKILVSFIAIAYGNGYKLNNSESDTLYNFLYLLSSKFLIQFGDHRRYFNTWYSAGKQLNRLGAGWVLAYIYQYLFYFRKFSKYFIKMRNIFFNLFKHSLPDTEELSKCKLYMINTTKLGNVQ